MGNSNTIKARLKLYEEHARAENAHDVAAIMATLGRQPRYVMNGTIIEGYDVIRDQYEGMGWVNAGGFSQLKVEATAWLVGEDAIVVEALLRGTHSAEWQGIPATGRSFAIPVCAIFTFDEEEKVADERIYFDSSLLLRQLGVLS